VILSLSELDKQSLLGGRFATDRVTELERLSLGEFLERGLESEDARELIGVATGLEVWWDKAFSMFLRDEIDGTGDNLEEIVGGTDSLPTAMAEKLQRVQVRLNTEVVSLQLVEGGVRFRTRPTNQKCWDAPPLDKAEVTEEFAEHLICTIPFGVLRRMPVEGITALKARAIRNLNYAASTKVLLHCKERFWERSPRRILGGASMSDSIARATYYPSDHAEAHPSASAERMASGIPRGLHTTFSLVSPPATRSVEEPGPGVLVGSYCWGRDARRLGALSETERAKAVLDFVEKIHPEVREYVDDCKSMAWDSFRWSRGAFCFMRPGDLRYYYLDAIRPEGRLHFAGEHCSLHQAWMQGALMSGLKAVEEIVSG
jgi:monoamine oxidase